MAFRSIQITGAPAELKAAAGYFLAVFASGFGLGTVRVLLIAPRLGEIAAVSIELPLLLSISWLACGWSLRRFGVSGGWERRAVVGALAFALLMAAEFGLAVLAFGRTASGFRLAATVRRRLGRQRGAARTPRHPDADGWRRCRLFGAERSCHGPR